MIETNRQPTQLLQALAQVGETAPGVSPPKEIELFRLRIGNEPFAVDSTLVQEVVRIPPLTPLPNAPEFLVGVAAHRGEVLAVVDIGRLLGREATEVRARTRLAIARWDGMSAALLADEVLGLARYRSSALQPAPLGTESSEFVAGIILADPPMHLLDLRRALSSARERAAGTRR